MIFLFLIGSALLIQCERNTPPQMERSEQAQNQQNEDDNDDQEDEYRRHDEGRGDDAAPGEANGHEVDVVDDREELIENMQELLSELVDELEERAETEDMEMETYEQVQDDQVELSRLINEAEETDDENWEEIKEEVQEGYVRIATDYNERVRPEGAHGGRSAWFLRNLG